MFNMKIMLDTNRDRSVDTDLTNISKAVAARTFETVYTVTQSVTGNINKVLEDFVNGYEISRMRNRRSEKERFSFGDKIVLVDTKTGEEIELFHCMTSSGYKII